MASAWAAATAGGGAVTARATQRAPSHTKRGAAAMAAMAAFIMRATKRTTERTGDLLMGDPGMVRSDVESHTARGSSTSWRGRRPDWRGRP
ncbi:hypothetical protein SQ03_18935 [Methylobacterium platani JCM 14648]|uniref:Uncharacterized protein n=2 Tax=Methylobacterium platani TaxID=427683 RepID=A0A179S8Q2_9HYPH|nr:hypothetical protein SQ03_18935 [Methylobacterium platani JCM 14648]OAS23903.1 hypothetical protein A5481_15750 [Methylobacterium platani]